MGDWRYESETYLVYDGDRPVARLGGAAARDPALGRRIAAKLEAMDIELATFRGPPEPPPDPDEPEILPSSGMPPDHLLEPLRRKLPEGPTFGPGRIRQF